MKTHWKKTMNKDYLGAHDLEPGKDLKVTIQRVAVAKVTDPQGTKTDCNVAYFVEKNVKPMILNVGACTLLYVFTKSNYIEDWQHVAVQIYIKNGVKAFGSIVDALRLRDFQPQMTLPELTPESPKWATAIERFKAGSINSVTKHYSISPKNMEILKNDAGIS